jgi:hypothetical protein
MESTAMAKIAALVALFAILAPSAPATMVLGTAERGNATAQITGQSGPECHDFQFQEDAQGFLEGNDWITLKLDPDGDGVACNELPTKADILPPFLLNTMMLEMGGTRQLPQIVFSHDFVAFLGGVVEQRYVDEVAGVVCSELSTGEALNDLIPPGSVVFLQDAGGNVPHLSPDATFMEPNVVSNALLWVWDGVSEPTLVNSWQIQNGYGVYSAETTPPEWKARFELNDQTARHNKKGVWGECNEPAPMLAAFEPTFEPPPSTIIASVGGDWSKSENFVVPADGIYAVTVGCPGPSCYIEVKTLQHLATGQEFPDLYFLLFGPDQYYTEM